MNITKLIHLLIPLFAIQFSYAQELARFEFTHQAMGTQFRFIFYAKNNNLAQKTVNQSIKKINTLNNIFSDYEADSEVSRVTASSGKGKKVKVSPELWQLVKYSQRYSKKSKGAFDITIGPLSKLWRSMFRKQEIFANEKILNAKSKVGYKKLKLFSWSKKVKLTQKGMRLDLGGIAKGFTVDEIVKIFKINGISQFLIDGGGDLYVGNAPPQKEGWLVNIILQGSNNTMLKSTKIVKNIAIASSGDTFRFLDWKGKRYSHIINPRTGYGVANKKVFTVLAPTCTQADVVASILSILNKEDQAEFLKKRKKLIVY